MKALILSMILLTGSMGLAFDNEFEETMGLTLEVKSTDGHAPSKIGDLDYTQANHPLPDIRKKKVNTEMSIELRGPSSDLEEPGI